MKQLEKFLAINSDEIAWQDGTTILGLPQGVQVKVLAEGEDEISEMVIKMIKFPPGYVEPRHTHEYFHSTFIIEGEMHVAGKILKHGDFVYGGGNDPHGPYKYPVGCTVYSVGRSKSGRSGQSICQIHRY